MVQWLRLRVSTTGGTSLIPGQGTKILHATQCGQKKKKYTHRIPIPAPASATPLPPPLQDRYSHYFSPYLSCGSFCKKINQMYMFPFS